MKHTILPLLAFGLLLSTWTGPAQAQDLIYQPKNPAFGGSHVNYRWMLNSANAQKDFGDDERSRFSRDPLQDFQQSLQRQILSQLSREVIRNRFGEDLDLSQPGRYELGEYVIEVSPGLNGVNIRVFNTFSGDETTITVPNP